MLNDIMKPWHLYPIRSRSRRNFGTADASLAHRTSNGVWVIIALILALGFMLSRDKLAQLSFSTGNYYFNVGGKGIYDMGRAEKYYRGALWLNPSVPDAWHQLARIDFLRGDFPAALEKINKQLAVHGDSLMASYYIRGLIQGYAGNLEGAEADFVKFLAWDPQNWATHNDLAWIYFRKGEFAKAAEIARRGLETNSENPWLLNSLGVALINLEKKDEAHEVLARASRSAASLTEFDWHRAYPGNDPRDAAKGLEEIKRKIEFNIRMAGLSR